jgi:hypothetical protein
MLTETGPDGSPSSQITYKKVNLPVYIPKLSWVMDEGLAGNLTTK